MELQKCKNPPRNAIISDTYAARFSEDELLGFLENDRISEESKNYVLDRSEGWI